MKLFKLLGLVLFAALLSTMLVFSAAPDAKAHYAPKPHGNGYPYNYYPSEYFILAEPDGYMYFGDTYVDKYTDRGWTSYTTKWYNGRKYYYVHVYYRWAQYKWGGPWKEAKKTYYLGLHKRDDPDSQRPRFRGSITYRETGGRYWRGFDHIDPAKLPQ